MQITFCPKKLNKKIVLNVIYGFKLWYRCFIGSIRAIINKKESIIMKLMQAIRKATRSLAHLKRVTYMIQTIPNTQRD